MSDVSGSCAGANAAAPSAEELEEQVRVLQEKLEALHCSDSNALRRAHTTLCQHIKALRLETEGISDQLQGVETDLLTPQHVAMQLGSAGAISLVTHWTARFLQGVFRDVKGLYRVTMTIGGVVLAVQLTRHSITRINEMARHNRTSKARLQSAWALAAQRVEIMSQLAEWEPQQPPAIAGTEGRAVVVETPEITNPEDGCGNDGGSPPADWVALPMPSIPPSPPAADPAACATDRATRAPDPQSPVRPAPSSPTPRAPAAASQPPPPASQPPATRPLVRRDAVVPPPPGAPPTAAFTHAAESSFMSWIRDTR